jgi:hypothetical protein
VDLPPSVNVDAAQWSFTTSPIWNCATSATTTITANTGGASISGDNCDGSATLGDISNNYAQTTGGPNVLVIRLKSLTVTGSHIIQFAGNEPVIFLVNGNVTIDSGGKIDASANGSTNGPGGDGSACGTSTGTHSTVTTTGGGGGSFGTAGGYGATSSGSNGSAAGAVAASLNLQPCYGVEHSGAAAMHLHTVRSFAFSATVSSPILIGSTVVCIVGCPVALVSCSPSILVMKPGEHRQRSDLALCGALCGNELRKGRRFDRRSGDPSRTERCRVPRPERPELLEGFSGRGALHAAGGYGRVRNGRGQPLAWRRAI